MLFLSINGNMKQIKSTYIKGIISELYVLIYLILKGYRPIKWRMRNKISEIDLIVKKNNILIAVEVKYRQKNDDGLYAISAHQKRKIRSAFTLFSDHSRHQFHTIRCDVYIVSGFGRIYGIQNAF
ncbi:MAG: putative endonuclease [Dasania sp.]|jgi:putative endonuclease